MRAREDHFMPSALLESQLRTLEGLEDDEAGLTVDVDGGPREIVEAVARWLGE